MEIWVIILPLLIVLFFYIRHKWRKKLRNKNFRSGFSWGRNEHFISRCVPWFIGLSIVTNYFGYYQASIVLSIIALILWFGYWISHLIEKHYHKKARVK